MYLVSSKTLPILKQNHQ